MACLEARFGLDKPDSSPMCSLSEGHFCRVGDQFRDQFQLRVARPFVVARNVRNACGARFDRPAAWASSTQGLVLQHDPAGPGKRTCSDELASGRSLRSRASAYGPDRCRTPGSLRRTMVVEESCPLIFKDEAEWWAWLWVARITTLGRASSQRRATKPQHALLGGLARCRQDDGLIHGRLRAHLALASKPGPPRRSRVGATDHAHRSRTAAGGRLFVRSLMSCPGDLPADASGRASRVQTRAVGSAVEPDATAMDEHRRSLAGGSERCLARHAAVAVKRVAGGPTSRGHDPQPRRGRSPS
jgi:hypothetical protein